MPKDDEPFICPPDHPHGESQACLHHGCKCDRCRLGRNERARRRNRLIAYGRGTMTDAEPVREHIVALRAQGMGVKAIAKVSGLAAPSIGAVVWGRGGNPPPARMTVKNANAILAVEFNLDNVLPAAMIDVAPTRRRLHSLARLGWTWTDLAKEAQMELAAVSKIANSQRKVQAATAVRVRDLYDRLWQTRPTPRDAYHESRMRGARRRAEKAGWPAPIEWEDIDAGITIDDVATTGDPVVADVEHLYGLGESRDLTVAAIGKDPDTLARHLRRHHRPDLARWVESKEAA